MSLQEWSPHISRQASRITGLAAAGTTSITEEEVNTTRRINDLQMTEEEKQELMNTKTFQRVQTDIKERQKRLRKNAGKVKSKLGKQQSEEQNYVDLNRQIANVQGIMWF